ncbi:hypothetical protein CYMTET_39377 [Cymbomonas tetramitiformis]|uniref:Uncharacterized protein n=1 Tax=Cymbomonas tetramitiformis TaxID=36881 RepID=A0AAE0CA69_9CHLO|nr:hypothetical protein CYMTET_39377 [Cymbomonas tetramitiformis]
MTVLCLGTKAARAGTLPVSPSGRHATLPVPHQHAHNQQRSSLKAASRDTTMMPPDDSVKPRRHVIRHVQAALRSLDQHLSTSKGVITLSPDQFWSSLPQYLQVGEARIRALGGYVKHKVRAVRAVRLSREAADGDDAEKAAKATKDPWRRRKRLQQLMAEGEAFERSCDPRAAQEVFTEAAALAPPGDFIPVLKLSKQMSDQVFGAYGKGEAEYAATRQLARDAAALTGSVLAQDPTNPYATLLHAANTGRLALFSDNKTKVELSRQVLDLLERVETNKQFEERDLVQHSLGVYQREMANIPVVVRWVVKMVYKNSLYPGDYNLALQHFKTAAELKPRMIHYVEMGKTYQKLKRPEDACKTILQGLALPVEDISHKYIYKDGEELLRKLQCDCTSAQGIEACERR